MKEFESCQDLSTPSLDSMPPNHRVFAEVTEKLFKFINYRIF